MQEKPEGLLDTKEIAARLGLNPETVRRWVRAGLLSKGVYRHPAGKAVFLRFDFALILQQLDQKGPTRIRL